MPWGTDIACIDEICRAALTWSLLHATRLSLSMAASGTAIAAVRAKQFQRLAVTSGRKNWKPIETATSRIDAGFAATGGM